MTKEGIDIKSEPVQTHNENGDRFVLTFGKDNSVSYYDNHKRDGYGLYSGDDSKGFMGCDSKISRYNFIELFSKLNELYWENQALKDGNEYHKILKEKFKEEKDTLFSLWSIALEKDDKDNAKYYLDLMNTLGEIEQYTFQGEEYE